MRFLFPALLALILAPVVASAHGMGMQAKVKDGTVRVEVFYDDDAPGSGAAVRVLNAAGEEVQKGTTDAAGVWECPAPPPGEYSVRAKTDDGHTAKEQFTVPPPNDPIPPPEPKSRALFTGPLKWVLVAVGVGLIGLGFTTFYFFARAMRLYRTPPE